MIVSPMTLEGSMSQRTEIDVRNGHILVGNYVARWWKFEKEYLWEIVPVEKEDTCFVIDSSSPISTGTCNNHHVRRGISPYPGDAQALAVGYAYVLTALKEKRKENDCMS